MSAATAASGRGCRPASSSSRSTSSPAWSDPTGERRQLARRDEAERPGLVARGGGPFNDTLLVPEHFATRRPVAVPDEDVARIEAVLAAPTCRGPAPVLPLVTADELATHSPARPRGRRTSVTADRRARPAHGPRQRHAAHGRGDEPRLAPAPGRGHQRRPAPGRDAGARPPAREGVRVFAHPAARRRAAGLVAPGRGARPHTGRARRVHRGDATRQRAWRAGPMARPRSTSPWPTAGVATSSDPGHRSAHHPPAQRGPMPVSTATDVQDAAKLLSDAPSPVVVVPVYDAYDDAVRCVEAITAHTDRDIAVLVVDDGSADQRLAELLGGLGDRIIHDVVVLAARQQRRFRPVVQRRLRSHRRTRCRPRQQRRRSSAPSGCGACRPRRTAPTSSPPPPRSPTTARSCRYPPATSRCRRSRRA